MAKLAALSHSPYLHISSMKDCRSVLTWLRIGRFYWICHHPDRPVGPPQQGRHARHLSVNCGHSIDLHCLSRSGPPLLPGAFPQCAALNHPHSLPLPQSLRLRHRPDAHVMGYSWQQCRGRGLSRLEHMEGTAFGAKVWYEKEAPLCQVRKISSRSHPWSVCSLLLVAKPSALERI